MSAFVFLQKVVPQRLITVCAGKLAEIRQPALKNFLIRLFLRTYKVDMSEARIEDPASYESFNKFFTRALKDDARPISANDEELVSPADGQISEMGSMHRGSLIQAKDIWYSARELLADDILAARMENGSFATVYLSPRDYHRVHVPYAGTLLGITYVPGKLFSVNDTTARSLDGLFTRNERIVAQFQTPDFTYALVMVGAMIVGGMETVVTGTIKRQKHIVELNTGFGRTFSKGEEFGRFHLGSTAIIVFPAEANVDFHPKLLAGSKIKMGDALGLLPAGNNGGGN